MNLLADVIRSVTSEGALVATDPQSATTTIERRVRLLAQGLGQPQRPNQPAHQLTTSAAQWLPHRLRYNSAHTATQIKQLYTAGT